MQELLYEDPVEVVEAMGYDPAFGLRQWFDGYHVEDLRALSQALFHMQRARVRWNRRGAYDDPFRQALEQWAKALMIEPARSRVEHRVHPSYFTWSPHRDFVLGAVQMFFDSYLEPPFERLRTTIELSADCKDACLIGHAGHRGTAQLTSIPERYVFLDASMLKGELMRRLFEAVEVVDEHRMCGYNVNTRALYTRAVVFADALWGIEV